MSSRQEVIKAVERAVMQDRNVDYAPPEQNFQRIADLWNVYLEGKTEVTPYDTAIMMVLVKVARTQASPHLEDHLVDIAGYAACAADVLPDTDRGDGPAHNRLVTATYNGEAGRLEQYGEGSAVWYSDESSKSHDVTDVDAAVTAGALVIQ